MRKTLFAIGAVLFGYTAIAQENKSIPELLGIINTSTDTTKINAQIELAARYSFKGQLDSATIYLDEGLAAAKTLSYEKGVANAYNAQGNVQLLKGNLEPALKLYLQSLSIREKLGLKTDQIPSYINISTVYLRQLQYDQSMIYLRKAWSLAVELKDSVRLAGIQNNYATIVANTGNMDSALFYLKRCVDISDRIEHRSDIDKNQLNHYKTNALLGIAQIISRKGGAPTILATLDSLWAKESNEGVPNKLRVLKIFTEASMRQSEFKKAVDYANYALQLDSGYRNPSLMVDFYSLLADSYFGMGDYNKAYWAAIHHNRFKDTLYARDKLMAVNELTTKYETDKKDREIADLNKARRNQRLIVALVIIIAAVILGLLLLVYRSKRLQQRLFRQKEELMVQQSKLEVHAREKKMQELEQMALRAQMNPHFIFNCLGSVQHFVAKQDIEGVNKYLSAFAHLIRQTLDNSSRQLISLDEEIKYLDTYLSLEQMKSNMRFRYSITISGNIDKYSVLVPGMILQPFVENSIRHGIASKPNNEGAVTVTFYSNGHLACVVEDNGIGRKHAQQIKSNQPASYQSKGLSLAMNRIDVINKLYGSDITVEIQDKEDEQKTATGTRVTILFPLDLD